MVTRRCEKVTEGDNDDVVLEYMCWNVCVKCLEGVWRWKGIQRYDRSHDEDGRIQLTLTAPPVVFFKQATRKLMSAADISLASSTPVELSSRSDMLTVWGLTGSL